MNKIEIRLLDYLSKQNDNEAGELYQVFGKMFFEKELKKIKEKEVD